MPHKKINNFLTPKSKKRKRKKRSKRGLIVSISIIGFCIVAGGVLFLLYRTPAQTVYDNGILGKDAFLAAQDQLLEQDLDAALGSLASATAHFETAQTSFKKFEWLSSLPWIGAQVKALDGMLGAGITTGQSIITVTEAAKIIIEPLEKDDQISLATLSDQETASLLMRIRDAKPALEDAQRSIDIAMDFIDSIPAKSLISKISESAAPLQEAVPQLQTAIDKAISASQIIPAIAGYPDQNIYLFLLQNNTELRPTGGFIGTYGVLKVKNGDIKSFTTDNVYNLDEPAAEYVFETPPWPLTRYNAVYQWLFRDSNWSPDFPTSAEKAEWFYHKEGGTEKNFDGVIAVTPTFIQSLIALTGDIAVNGLTFTSENFVDTLQYQVNEGFLQQGLDESERKEIIGSLSSILLDRIIELPRSEWPDLWDVFSRDIDEKQILIYSKDDVIQTFIEKENWGGVITATDGDYLSFFDANLASLKSDPAVQRTVSYSVERDGKNLIADVYIEYDNQGTITWKTTRYRSYTRVLVPQGSVLLSSSGAMVDCKLNEEGSVETSEELGKTVFGAFICIEPGEKQTLHYKYSLPDRIYKQFTNDSYQLLVQKQPGTANYGLNLAITMGKRSSTIEGIDTITKEDHNTVSINTTLDSDQELHIEY